MRIEKIDDNKLKIMFNSDELEENNITVHSFLSGSNEAKKLFLAILDIANEEFGFDIENCNIFSETLSFGNKNFIIFITKKFASSENIEKLIYRFDTIEDLFQFCKYANFELENIDIENSLYKYNDSFFIVIDIEKLDVSKKQLVISILSEYTDNIYLSPLAFAKFLEHSFLILSDRAIQSL